MGRFFEWRGATAFLCAALALLVLAPVAQAAFPCGTALSRCQVQVDNSGRVWFESYERLTEDAPGDGTLQHGITEIYERDGNTTRLISRLPDGSPILPEGKPSFPVSLVGASPDGERIYLKTEATLAPEDTDGGQEGGSWDAYVLADGHYTLLSTGPLDNGSNPNPWAGSQQLWASDDGSYVYFETGQSLVAADWDGMSDIYQRHEGQTRLVSTGPAEPLPTSEYPDPRNPESRFLGASPDGATAYFATATGLTADDTGRVTPDIYAWHDGTTTRLTRTVSPEDVPGTPWESFDPYSFAGAGETGDVYFTANSAQTADDADTNPDVYRARPDGTLERLALSPPGVDTADSFLRLQAVSRDGSRLFLFSSRQLAAADHDDKADIYMWSNGSFELISPEARPRVKDEELLLNAISADGHRAYFQTWGRLTADDTDEEPDVYEWSDGRIRLVSPSVDGHPSASFFKGISPSGRYVSFSTWESLLPGDDDDKSDLYVIDMGAPGAGSAARAAIAGSPSRKQPGKRRRARLRLVTAEAIPPRMGIAATGTRSAAGAKLRLSCPKAERSGPCHGRVKLLARGGSHRVLARASFRVARAHRTVVELRGRNLPRRALARITGADMLGNRRTVSATVTLRGAKR